MPGRRILSGEAAAEERALVISGRGVGVCECATAGAWHADPSQRPQGWPDTTRYLNCAIGPSWGASSARRRTPEREPGRLRHTHLANTHPRRPIAGYKAANARVARFPEPATFRLESIPAPLFVRPCPTLMLKGVTGAQNLSRKKTSSARVGRALTRERNCGRRSQWRRHPYGALKARTSTGVSDRKPWTRIGPKKRNMAPLTWGIGGKPPEH